MRLPPGVRDKDFADALGQFERAVGKGVGVQQR